MLLKEVQQHPNHINHRLITHLTSIQHLTSIITSYDRHHRRHRHGCARVFSIDYSANILRVCCASARRHWLYWRSSARLGAERSMFVLTFFQIIPIFIVKLTIFFLFFIFISVQMKTLINNLSMHNHQWFHSQTVLNLE